jgi:cation diffusion facilitator family transporter
MTKGTPKHSLAQWQHPPLTFDANQTGERRTRYVLYLTLVTMVAEIVAGTVFGSMALLADGWHMGTHAAAFSITLFAYAYARKHADNPQFSFGTGKVSVLGGYTSAIALGLVALIMLVESVNRLFQPMTIHFDEAIWVACIGLAVNVLSVWLLKDHHSHDHKSHAHHREHSHDNLHNHNHGHHNQGQDHNLRAAYFHVLADALTSVLAIVALLFGKYLGASWLDPVMGMVGAIIIARWSWGLVQQTSPILLDGGISRQLQRRVREEIEQVEDHEVADLHIWRISAEHYALMVSIVSHAPRRVEHFQRLLEDMHLFTHITIEMHTCRQPDCVAQREGNSV